MFCIDRKLKQGSVMKQPEEPLALTALTRGLELLPGTIISYNVQ